MSAFWRTALIGVVLAGVAVGVVWIIANAVSDDLFVTLPGGDEEQRITLPFAVIVTLFQGAVGAAVVWLFRRQGWSARTFLIIVAVFLVIQGIIAFVAADTAMTGVWLNVMHLAAALVLVPLFLRLLNEPDARRTAH